MCSPSEQSSSQLAEFVHASPGAISTATRQLMTAGMVERVRIRGERAYFFRIKAGCWSELIHVEVQRVRHLREIADRGLALLATRASAPTTRLQEFRDFNHFLEQEMPALVARWDSEDTS